MSVLYSPKTGTTTTLSSEIDGHTATAQVMCGWIYWRLNPPLPGLIPCSQIWMEDPGPALRIERLTESLMRSKGEGDGPRIAAANNLFKSLGMPELSH